MRRDSARPDPPEYTALRQIIQQHSRPGDRVLIIATSVRPAYPMLLQMGRRPGSRYLCVFPIAFFYAGAEAKQADRPVYRRWRDAPPEERRFIDELRDDVLCLQPRLIVIQNSPGWLGLPEGFNTFDYLVYSGWLEAALSSYREISAPKGWKVLQIEKW